MWELEAWLNNSHIYLDNVFTDEELAKIIEIGEAHELKFGETSAEVVDYRKSKIAWLHPNMETSFIYYKIGNAIKAINEQYFKFDLFGIENLQFSEYDSAYGGEYKAHLDIGGYEIASRKLSFSIQLSDPSEYEGGELAIYIGDLDKPEICKKAKGLMTAFPSTMIHAVKPVTSGKRQALVGWVRGPRFR